MTPHDSCTVYEQSYAIHICKIRWFLPGAAGCKSLVTVRQTDDYIALSPNQRQDFASPFTGCRMDSPNDRAKPRHHQKKKKGKKSARDKEVETLPCET